MAVYRFRAHYEEHEDVYRDIEIKAGQSFDDLHFAVQQAFAFDSTPPASFFTSDDYWRRDQEIKTGVQEEKGKKKATKKELEAQRKVVIADYVNDPHQRFVYVFDSYKEWVFLLELAKILNDEPGAQYPRCVKSAGTAPKQYRETKLPPPPDDEEEDIKPEKEQIVMVENDKHADEDEVEGMIPLGDDGEPIAEEGEDVEPEEDGDAEAAEPELGDED